MKSRKIYFSRDLDIALINECYARALDLLKKNSEPSGIIACARSAKSVGRNYASIFGRDAAIDLKCVHEKEA